MAMATVRRVPGGSAGVVAVVVAVPVPITLRDVHIPVAITLYPSTYRFAIT